MSKGLLMVHTGNGKGKTTAALGLAFRALGQGLQVCVIQFIKGSGKYGEMTAAERFSDLLEFHVMGRGFTWKSDDPEKDRAAAREAWDTAREKIGSGDYRLVILDEMTYPLAYKMLPEDEVLDFLKHRPDGVHVVITGRNASAGLVETADMVTEMTDIKHHFRSGIKAQRGIEF